MKAYRFADPNPSRHPQSAHEVSDGFCIFVCPRDRDSEHCGLEVARPGKVQCWCDDEEIA